MRSDSFLITNIVSRVIHSNEMHLAWMESSHNEGEEGKGGGAFFPLNDESIISGYFISEVKHAAPQERGSHYQVGR